MFPDRLKALRTGRGLTLKQLASALNQRFKDRQHPNSNAQIENWERGTRIPPYPEIMKLARYFNVSMDYLTGRSYDDRADLANYLIADKDLKFAGQELSANDRDQIYALIQGYLNGKKKRGTTKKNSRDSQIDAQQQELKLNLKK